MPHTVVFSRATIPRDITAGVVVFLVALPLCLGVALASGAPPFSGVLAGIVGGIVVGCLSGSHTSVSGPAAGLTAIVAMQIERLEAFETFLLAVSIAGAIQIVLGLARAGFIAAFIPSAVIKGLLAAIGIIIILKQVPHLLGHDVDPEGEMSFSQPDHRNTFTEFLDVAGDLHPGAAAIGLGALALLLFWDSVKLLKKSPLPAPLLVVLLGVGVSQCLSRLGAPWAIEQSHRVEMPVAGSLGEFLGFLKMADFAQWTNPAVYGAGLTIALVATLETLLNLEAVDKLDPRQRMSPPNQELLAQGVGNLTAGLVGGIPVTSVIVRSSVNINSGGQTKLSAMIHGGLLLGCAMLLPHWLNAIPLSCLAAILLATGVKLASPALFREMAAAGRYQFVPFIVTISAIVLTDLLVGVLIGLGVSMAFILNSNLRRPMLRVRERHPTGEVLRIELGNQVSFLNRAAIEQALHEVPRNGHVLLDATHTDYIDPDILDVIRQYRDHRGPARGVHVSLVGFRKKYQLQDEIQFVDYPTRELQAQMSPTEVLEFLLEGNRRFCGGQRLSRDLAQSVQGTAQAQHPLAVVLGCIDSRTSVELVFDVGLGDVFSARIAGNIISSKILGSMEYACAAAGARLVLVMGHTRCGAVTEAVRQLAEAGTATVENGSPHLQRVLSDIQRIVDPDLVRQAGQATPDERAALIDDVARQNVQAVVQSIPRRSRILAELAQQGRIAIVGAMYDVNTGHVEVLSPATVSAAPAATSR